MPETFPVTGLIHHLAPEPQSPPSRSCQEKPPFPAAGCHGNPSLRIPSQRPASSLDHGHAAPRRGLQKGGGYKTRGLLRAPRERHPPVQPSTGTHGSARRDARPGQRDADGGSLPLVKKGKESGEPKILINPLLPAPAPARNLTCC